MTIPPERINALAQRMLQSALRSPRFKAPSPLRARETLLLSSWTRRFLRDEQLVVRVLVFLRRPRERRRRGERELRGLMEDLVRTVQEFERTDLQDLALEAIPESAYTSIEGILASHKDERFAEDDALAISLLRWFKNDFMRWVDPIACPVCGGNTRNVGGAEPAPEERRGGAGRVELWACAEEEEGGTKCQGLRRFARYNDIPTLLRTREGRCGEFAHLFTHLLRSVGLTARYIYNAEDHVWSEYWSAARGHWVHLDPSEGEHAWDKPWLYERGWGKGMSYCFAVGKEGVEDVSRVYAVDWEACRKRRGKYSEAVIEQTFAELTTRLRAPLSPERRKELDERDKLQLAYKNDAAGRLAAAEEDRIKGELKVRQSGSKEWRAIRQELGLDGAAPPMPIAGACLFSHPGPPGPRFHGTARWIDQTDPQVPRIIQLTPCTPSSCGTAFCSPLLADVDSIIFDTTFRIVKDDPGAEGADGMAFVCLHHEADKPPTKFLGGGGAGMGYEGLGGKGDWAIEIDTYRSRDSCNDPPTPHISLHSPPRPHHRNALACTAPDSLPPVDDGSWRTLRIQHDLKQKKVRAWLLEPILGAVKTEDSVRDGAIFLWEADLPETEPGETMVTYGLTAATGGFAQAHEVGYWRASLGATDAPAAVKDDI